MFHFRGLVCHKNSNGDYELISINGIEGNDGLVDWAESVGGVRVRIPINKYIPQNNVAVVFRLVPIYPDPPSRLLQLCHD